MPPKIDHWANQLGSVGRLSEPGRSIIRFLRSEVGTCLQKTKREHPDHDEREREKEVRERRNLHLNSHRPRLMDDRAGAASAIIVVDEQELDKLAGRKLLPLQPGWLPIFPVAPGGSSA